VLLTLQLYEGKIVAYQLSNSDYKEQICQKVCLNIKEYEKL